MSSARWAHSTIRSYEGALGMFMAYLIDPRYGWAAACEEAVGAVPSQICHEWNTAVHVTEYEGRPERRPLTRAELQAFFDAADDRAEAVAASGRKGSLAAFRDATLFKLSTRGGFAAGRRRCSTSATSPPIQPRQSPRPSGTWAPKRRWGMLTERVGAGWASDQKSPDTPVRDR
jgi:hypothetical protein